MPHLIRDEQTFLLGSISQAEVELQIAKGELRVRGGASEFCEATFKYSHAELKPETEFDADGEEAELSIRHPDVSIREPTKLSWDLRFNGGVTTEFGIESASGTVDLDFTGVLLKNVEVESASGEVKLRIGGGCPELREIVIDSTSGSVNVDLEGDFPALERIEVDTKSGRIGIAAAGNCPNFGRIEVNATSGQVTIDLGACDVGEEDMNVRVNAVSGMIIVTIPEDAGASLGASVVTGSVKADGFRVDGGRMTNAAFGQAQGTIWLNLKAISGSIRVLEA